MIKQTITISKHIVRKYYVKYGSRYETNANLVQHITPQERDEIINAAFRQYNSINAKQRAHNSKLITDILNLCSIYDQPHKALFIWNDIQQVNGIHIPYSLLLKCLIRSNHIDSCIELITQHRTSTQQLIQMDTNTLQRLIQLCSNSAQINVIHEWISTTNVDDIVLYHLCLQYAKHNDMDSALNMLNEMDSNTKTEELIGCLMRACIHNNRFDDVLYLFDASEGNQNPAICCMALTACIQLKHVQKGKEIEQSFGHSVAVANGLIELYGKCVSVGAAKRIFNEIPNRQMDTHTYWNMLNVLLHHKQHAQALAFYHVNVSHLDHTQLPSLHCALIECKYSMDMIIQMIYKALMR